MIKLRSVYKKYKKSGFFSKDEIFALKDVNLTIDAGEHIGIIGESGAGKTTLGKILSLIELPSSGSVFFDLDIVDKRNLKQYRKKMGAVFQDPYTSFDPRLKVVESLKETDRDIDVIYEVCSKLNIKKELLPKYPHQLSGGEQQRVAIARVLLSNAEYIVFDEATSALDASTQARIINLLCNINRDKRYSYIFISHDLKLARFISDKIYVLYGGYVVEEYPVFDEPAHPYSQMLLGDSVAKITKDMPGCFFYGSCRYRKNICKNSTPELKSIGKNHKVRCFLYD